ncbi:hypothetical protein EJ05DRAFT_503395 [Pseudovirgaria hyperparasitica]|uniref:MARVEL domain-containing protein n=1 Tax=Pseudovirgaria hyperparasitica TaxID=470096 RepID=A0A6A6VXW5_9PEZI|nr:uncharacterized protein EJ05DRAFT_503395 [Pseudovirgaria hyperparasitica]KAF2755083.1 hypothetical protein EJ05DRAFT_503395 [Pseudovirgaria hyperparasitica]
MTFNFTLPLRAAQGLFVFIDLVLMSYVAHWWSGAWHVYSPPEINFLIFCCAWTILALAYLIVAPARFPKAAHKFGILGAEFLTMIFWFAGFIALAAYLGDRWCIGTVCNCAKAGVAFAAFLWVLFAATFAMALLHVWKTRNTNDSRPDPKIEMHQGA